MSLKEIVEIRFRETGKLYSFAPNGLVLTRGQHVIVETARGLECGEVLTENHEVEDEKIVAPLKNVIRVATAEDEKTIASNREKEAKALEIAVKKIEEHKLEMKFIDVEYTFDGSKVLFYFTADGRVDFRELVKDLAGVFRTRIELRQVGVRDEAKLLGGLGICGRPFCCSEFLGDFHPVSIKMAKEQSLSLNPTKISGTCGRLMCCLKYEQEAYEDLNRTTPRVNSIVKTPQGTGTVVDVALLRGNLKVRLDDSSELTPKCFNKCDCCLLQKPTGKRKKAHEDADAPEQEEKKPKSAQATESRKKSPPPAKQAQEK